MQNISDDAPEKQLNVEVLLTNHCASLIFLGENLFLDK